jgi:integrase
MAWLYKHPKSGRWFLGWRVGKKSFNRSTGTADRKEAEKQLSTVQLMVTTNREGKLNEAVYRSLTGQSLQRVALKPAVADYLLRCTPRVSTGTLKAYRSALDDLLESVHATDTKPDLADITKDVLEKYLANYRLRASAKSCNNKVKYIGTFFRDADQKYHTGDPTKHIATYHETPAEADAPDRRPFTAVELGKVYSVAPDGFWKVAIKCAYFTGFRLGRIATLQWQHVDFENRIFDVKDVKPQKKKKVAVPIMDGLFNDLKSLRASAGDVKPTDYLWPAQAQLYREQGAAPLSYEFHQVVLVPAGLVTTYKQKADRRTTNEVSFHSIKHSVVTGMKSIGAPEMIVREMVGHDSAAVSAIYTHASTEQTREHLKRLPSPFTKNGKDKK